MGYGSPAEFRCALRQLRSALLSRDTAKNAELIILSFLFSVFINPPPPQFFCLKSSLLTPPPPPEV